MGLNTETIVTEDGPFQRDSPALQRELSSIVPLRTLSSSDITENVILCAMGIFAYAFSYWVLPLSYWPLYSISIVALATFYYTQHDSLVLLKEIIGELFSHWVSTTPSASTSPEQQPTGQVFQPVPLRPAPSPGPDYANQFNKISGPRAASPSLHSTAHGFRTVTQSAKDQATL
jgi:hypothetical protein